MHLGDKTYLEGIILSISTHSGPHVVYSYERETPINYLTSSEHKFYNDHSDSDSVIDWSDSEGEFGSETSPMSKTPIESLKKQLFALSNEHNNSKRPQTAGHSAIPGLLFGQDPSALAEVLCPPRSMCNKRFQMTIDNKTYLGIPIHIGDSGRWSHKHEALEKTYEQSLEKSQDKSPEKSPEYDVKPESSGLPMEDSSNPLIMFHVCFVLNPPIAEGQYVCDELYHHVLTQVISLFRHEQRRRNYVWDQAKNIMWLKETNASHEEILAQSELAKALYTLFDSISKLDIAHLSISGKIRPFQVPVHREVDRIPMFVGEDSKFYGCQPTTAKDPNKEIDIDCPDCYSLLLLDDPDEILKRINAEPTGPLAALVHKVNPTQSLQQMAKENDIPVKQMINMAYSLVFWRCASIIIPLNHRYTYTVSPLAPMGKLYGLSKEYTAQFPMMPPLHRFLSTLSTGRPQHYANHIPSRDHHLVYMHCLAWSIRQNLVVHMQSFGILFVPHKVKLEVLREEEEQADAPDEAESEEVASAAPRKASAHDNSTKPAEGRINLDTKRSSAYEEYVQLLDSFVANPTRASLAEKKWIYNIASKHSSEFQNLFYRMLKYFNGKDCLEQAFLHEKLGRQEQRRFLQEYEENIMIYQHF